MPADAAERMARALSLAPGERAAAYRSGAMCIGVVDKELVPGAGQLLRKDGTGRTAVFQGEVLAFDGAGRLAGSKERAESLFTGALSDRLLASAVGPFAAVILDEREAAIEVVGDRYGHYLIYWATCGRAVIFASQIKALLASGVVPVEVDEEALALMLTIGEVTGELTLVRGVRALPAGSVARITADGLSVRRYWDYRFGSAGHADFGEAAERCGELLVQAVERICAAHPQVAVPLSGGLDSRVALAAVPDPSRVPSHTWGLPGCRDLRYGAAAARVLGSPHHGYEYDPRYVERVGEHGIWLTEGTCDLTDMHVRPYVEAVRASAPVTLDGLAGDAILGGNFIRKEWWQAREPRQAGAALWNWRAGMLGPEVGAALLGGERYASITATARDRFLAAYTASPGETEMDRAMAFLLDNRVRRCSCGGTHLFRWRIEPHFPFYDNDFFDYVCTLPHAWRHRHRLYVEMIRRRFAAVGRVRWQRTGLAARHRWPARFVSAAWHKVNERVGRAVPGFDLFPSRHVARFDLWFRGPLRPFVERVLLAERTRARGLLRDEGVRLVLDRHQAGANHAKLIGVLVGIELFCRSFIEELDASVRAWSTPVELAMEHRAASAVETVG